MNKFSLTHTTPLRSCIPDPDYVEGFTLAATKERKVYYHCVTDGDEPVRTAKYLNHIINSGGSVVAVTVNTDLDTPLGENKHVWTVFYYSQYELEEVTDEKI